MSSAAAAPRSFAPGRLEKSAALTHPAGAAAMRGANGGAAGGGGGATASSLGAPGAGSKAKKTHKKTKSNHSVNFRELQLVKDISAQMQTVSVLQRKEASLRGIRDLKQLKELTSGTKKEREMFILRLEALAAVINVQERKRIIKSSITQQLSAEKDLAATLMQHREEFAQWVWKRRLSAKEELRSLFQAGSANADYHQPTKR